MDWFTDPNAWLGLLTLTALEIVLGIDNIIFISILSSRLSPKDQPKARKLGLMGAFVTRVLLLLSIAWVVKLTAPLFTLVVPISGRSLILILGGLFLIGKATFEIHSKLEGEDDHPGSKRVLPSLTAVVAQIMVVDIVFSLDSVITAVGMVDQVSIMMLALAFLVLIGTNLVAEGLGQHFPKGYTYFAMGFSVLVEMLNMRLRKKSTPVHLHRKVRGDD
jgi:predicted tellurium resistance membrane protein TerC